MRTRRSRGTRVAPLLIALALLTPVAGTADQDPGAERPARAEFREIWAYLMRGEERALTGQEPITDLCYFSASLSRTGRIVEQVSRPRVAFREGLQPAIHLVITELSNPALMHFALEPRYGVRPLLVEDICRVAAGFDGVQIDFEAVSRYDADNFHDFLRELRSRLPTVMRLSVAVPARTKLVNDAYDYTRIAPIVDRLVIMAYDEHWSASAPGPVASLSWCARVAAYARSSIERGKIVMGLPLYGRAWQDKRLARALRFESVQDLVAETSSQTNYSPELGAYFEYSQDVIVTVYYDDLRSITDKLALYRARDIESVSFWRIGQGPPELWSIIAASRQNRGKPFSRDVEQVVR